MALAEPDDVDLLAQLDALEMALPGSKAEYIGGQYVVNRPSRPHQKALGVLYVHLSAVVEDDHEVLIDPRVSAPGLEMVPDLAVFPVGWMHQADPTVPHSELTLAVEILSPSTEHTDRTTKRALFQQAGVDFWLVDPDTMAIEVYGYGGGRYPTP